MQHYNADTQCSGNTAKVQQQTCKPFRKVAGVSQEVLPIRISRPSLTLSLCATRISLLVIPPTTKATRRFPYTSRSLLTLPKANNDCNYDDAFQRKMSYYIQDKPCLSEVEHPYMVNC